MTATDVTTARFSPLQADGIDWLRERQRAYLADPPGFGKTRQLLAACGDAEHVTVIAPAAIRDTRVWEREATTIGFDRPLRVLSYHQLAGAGAAVRGLAGGAVVFDEAHRLKSRNVSWAGNAQTMVKRAERVYLASGTPTPNGHLPEFFGQMRLLRDDLTSYWRWVREWFLIEPTPYTAYGVDGTLLGCAAERCDRDADCLHKQRFWDAEIGPWTLRRPEGLLDLPEAAGFNTPLDTPMTAEQRRVYLDLKRDLLAETAEGITLEALTQSQKFVQMWQASTGLSSVVDDPTLDKHSGKAALVRELLPERSHPTLLAVWFRNTAFAMKRLCDDLGLRSVMFGAATSPKDRLAAVEGFQRGDVDVMIGSIATITEGLTLTAADQLVMVERSWTPGMNEQVMKRLLRRGQTKSVIVRQLVTPRSVDAGQWTEVQSKQVRIGQTMSKAEIGRLV